MGQGRRFSWPTVFVFGVWAALTAAAFWFVAHYGRNCPFADEWAIVPWITGRAPVTPGWIFLAHNEHHIPLPKAILVGLYALSNRNFLLGAFLNVCILSAAALTFVWTLARWRGFSRWSDAIFPAVILSWMHADNMLSGWQIQFTLPVLFAALYMLCTLRPGKLRTRDLLLGTACLFGAIGSGANGLLLGAFLGVTLFRLAGRNQAVPAAVCLAALAIATALLWPGPTNGKLAPPFMPKPIAYNAFGLLGASLGPGFSAIDIPYGLRRSPLTVLETQRYGSVAVVWPMFAVFLLAMCVATLAILRRACVVPVCFWGAGLATLGALSFTRQVGWETLPGKHETLRILTTHYALALIAIPLGAYLLWETAGRGRPAMQGTLALSAIVAALAALPVGTWAGQRRAAELDSLMADAARFPSRVAAARHIHPPLSGTLADSIRLLRDCGHPSFRDAAPGK